MLSKEDKVDVVLVTEGGVPLVIRQRASVIKMTGHMCSDAFKSRLGSSFTLISLA